MNISVFLVKLLREIGQQSRTVMFEEIKTNIVCLKTLEEGYIE